MDIYFTENRRSPVVTVIIAAWNEEKFIGRCIRSLLSQSFSRDLFQIIVIDDGSTDKTPYALDLFKGDIIVINNNNNLGLPASLNRAINYIKTPYFVRVDADDYVSNDFLLFLYNFIVQNKYMDAVACDYNLIDDTEKVLLRKDCMKDPIACGIIFKTDQIIDIGLYDEDFLLHEERDLRIRFLKKHNIHRLELALYRYRRHEKNITNDKDAMTRHMSHLISKHNLEK
jgi:glycosyltransferase involved in cell wall biosynthesis